MGFRIASFVYRLARVHTTPSEQAVLSALAFRADDRTLLCYPKQDTLVAMTHLSRSTVAAALRSLRRKGFISWVRGGNAVKPRKGRTSVSNSYALNVAKISSLVGRKMPGTVAAAKANLGVADAGAANVDANQPAAVPEDRKLGPLPEDFSPIRRIMAILGFESNSREYKDNYHAYMKWMKKLGEERSKKVVLDFEQQLKDGDFDAAWNLPGLFMSRLQDAVAFYGDEE